jgi:hypothetical protein
MLSWERFVRGGGDELPGIVYFGWLVPDSMGSVTFCAKLESPTYSVRKSFATCGVIVILVDEVDMETGGGRRKDRYQYILPTCEFRQTSKS